MKHYLVKKKSNPGTHSSHFYLWDILAHGIVERLKKIKLKGNSIALIGPSSMVIHTYLMMRYPLMQVDCFEEAWQMSDQSYDLIVINGIVSWLNAPAAFIEDVFSVLNANGLLLLSSLGPDTLQAIQQAAKIVSDIEK
jgi:SAM-dependent methyltransferase